MRMINWTKIVVTSVVMASGILSSGLAQAEEDATGGQIKVGFDRLGVGPGVFYNALGDATAGLGADLDFGKFQIVPTLSFGYQNDATFGLGGHFYYLVSKSDVADFGLGGGFALGILPGTAANAAAQNLGTLLGGGAAGKGTTFIFQLDAGARIRAFIIKNVALTASFGLAVAFGDIDAAVNLGASPVGAGGLFYYF